MADTTTRFGITEPSADRHDAADVPLYLRSVTGAVESLGVKYGQGTFANLPAALAANQGMIYFATDQSKLYYCNGSTWTDVSALAALSVGTAQLQDNAVTLPKMADDSVGSAEIIADSVGSSEIAPQGVTAVEIANALKPSAGAGGATEALRALGVAAGTAAAGTHASQHGSAGADPLVVTLAMLDATVTALLPQPGDIRMVAYDVVAGVNEPAGWKLADGRSQATGTDPNLFAKIGYSHGGAGANYNLPFTLSRSPMGKGQGAGLSLRNVGQTFGEELHVNTIGETPSHSHGGGNHNHSISDPGHLHALPNRAFSNSAQGYAAGGFFSGQIMVNGANSDLTTSQGTGIGINNSGAIIAAEGGGAGHNTVHPCFVVAFLIKT